MVKRITTKPKLPIYIIVLVSVLGLIGFGLLKSWQSKFEAPRKNTPDIQLTISKDRTLESVIGDLKYYNFIKDEGAFTFALEHTQDNTKDRENAIKVGKGSKTIDRGKLFTQSPKV